MFGFVYCLVFPNGKEYIGQTTQSLSKRVLHHKDAAKRGMTSRVATAVRLHDEFFAMILIECADQDELDMEERRFIRERKSMHPHGYNDNDGGRKGFKISAEHGAAISAGNTGKKRSQKTRARLREVNLGKKQSAETKAKRAESNRGQKRTPEQRARMSAGRRGKKMPNISKALLGHDVKQQTRDAISAKLTGRKQPKKTCPHCGKVGGGNAMTRFHFDNCKRKTCRLSYPDGSIIDFAVVACRSQSSIVTTSHN